MITRQAEDNYEKLKDFGTDNRKETVTKNIDPKTNKKNLRIPGSFRIKQFFTEILTNKEIVSKIGATLFIIVIYRALSSIPLPGLDMSVYKEVFNSNSASEANYLFAIFTGSRLDSPSIVGLGIAAYINASIIIQLMTPVIPKLTELSKDGERGRQVINQYTRFLTLPISFLYSVAYLLLLAKRDLNSTDGVTASANPQYLIAKAAGSDWPSITKIIFMTLILAAGTMLVMWLSEIITEKGIGNGSSIIIMVGILSSLPALIKQDFSGVSISDAISLLFKGDFSALTSNTFVILYGVIIGAILVITAIIYINEAARKIPISYARRAVQTGDSNLPIKLTLTGVLPIIFASSFLSVPQLIIPFIQNAIKDTQSFAYELTEKISNSFLFSSTDNVVNSHDLVYGLVYFVLIVIFGIFYSFVVIKPNDTAENLQKSSAFIPGIRPGKSTEKYLSYILLRIGFVGAICLGIIALIPLLARILVVSETGRNLALLSGIGGTSILIAVSVILDTVRQFNSLRVSSNYEKYT